MLFQGCASSKVRRTHYFYNPVLTSILDSESVEEDKKKYCFLVRNNSTASITFKVCDVDLEKVKACYLKLSVLQRSLRGIKERKDWSRYRPPYLVLLTKNDDRFDNNLDNFKKCRLIKNNKFLYNNIDSFSEISSDS
jgi:hypothetical protein